MREGMRGLSRFRFAQNTKTPAGNPDGKEDRRKPPAKKNEKRVIRQSFCKNSNVDKVYFYKYISKY